MDGFWGSLGMGPRTTFAGAAAGLAAMGAEAGRCGIEGFGGVVTGDFVAAGAAGGAAACFATTGADGATGGAAAAAGLEIGAFRGI